jgi:hypothetical protein
MGRTPQIDWIGPFAFYASLEPWHPGALRGFDMRPALVRALYPPELRRTYADVARAFGVSRQAVQQHATRYGWRELARQLDREVYAAVVPVPRRRVELMIGDRRLVIEI